MLSMLTIYCNHGDGICAHEVFWHTKHRNSKCQPTSLVSFPIFSTATSPYRAITVESNTFPRQCASYRCHPEQDTYHHCFSETSSVRYHDGHVGSGGGPQFCCGQACSAKWHDVKVTWNNSSHFSHPSRHTPGKGITVHLTLSHKH